MRAYMRTRVLTGFDQIPLHQWNLVEFDGLWRTIADNFKQSQTVADSYLLSVSPRHSYCNWASPVTGIENPLKLIELSLEE